MDRSDAYKWKWIAISLDLALFGFWTALVRVQDPLYQAATHCGRGARLDAYGLTRWGNDDHPIHTVKISSVFFSLIPRRRIEFPDIHRPTTYSEWRSNMADRKYLVGFRNSLGLRPANQFPPE